ncbi:MAG: hypothetical protein ABJB86_02910 [Bacteroidota bacterium]
MNNTFNVKRFGWLLKKTILERPAQLLGLTALSFLLSFIIYGIVRMMSDFEDAQNFSFLIGLIGGGCFLASFVFGHFTTNAAGSSFLTLPASLFEKWLCGVVITGVFYLFLYLLFFRLMDIGFVAVYHHGLDHKGPYFKEQYEAVRVLAYDEFIADKAFMMFFNFAGIMLVGSLYFNKAAFIKVALIGCGICLGAFLLNMLIANIFFKNVQTAFPYYLVWLMEGKERGRLELPEATLQIVHAFFKYIIPVILWALAFLRLKEKEF